MGSGGPLDSHHIWRDESGQIIATSHDRFPPNGGLVREMPSGHHGRLLFTAPTSGVTFGRKGNALISGKSRLVKYYEPFDHLECRLKMFCPHLMPISFIKTHPPLSRPLQRAVFHGRNRPYLRR